MKEEPPKSRKIGTQTMEGTLEEKESKSAAKSHVRAATNNLSSDIAEQHENPNAEENDAMHTKKVTKRKKGIIYVSNIPRHMNVTRMRETLGAYGEIGRIYLQPEKLPGDSGTKKRKHKRLSRHFTEGWIEFKSKRRAKQVVEFLNNKQVSTRKKSQFYDYMWSMKYLPRFKWVHLTERMNYEQAVQKQRLLTEVSQARKETNFFQDNLDRSEYLHKRNLKNKKKAEKVLEGAKELEVN